MAGDWGSSVHKKPTGPLLILIGTRFPFETDRLLGGDRSLQLEYIRADQPRGPRYLGKKWRLAVYVVSEGVRCQPRRRVPGVLSG